MKTKNRCFIIAIIINVISVVVFIISVILEFGIGLKGEYYLEINDDNRALIFEMCEMGGISLKGELSQIGCKQCLGDWELYLTYEDGSSGGDILNDLVAWELRAYIRENGSVGGTKGVIVIYLVLVSGLIMSASAICLLIFKFVNPNKNSKGIDT